MNKHTAIRAAAAIGPLVTSGSKPKVLQKNTPQQQNGSDCGMHVLAVCEALLLAHKQEHTISSSEAEKLLFLHATPDRAIELRQVLLDFINANIAPKK